MKVATAVVNVRTAILITVVFVTIQSFVFIGLDGLSIAARIAASSVATLLLAAAAVFLHQRRIGQLTTSLRERERELERTGRRLADARGRYATLTENNEVGFWEATIEGISVWVNPAMCRMLEVDGPEEIIGRSYREFFTEDSLARMEPHTQLRTRGMSSSYEAEIVGRRGGHHHVIVFGAPVSGDDGKPLTVIGTFTDVTAARRMEQQLRQTSKMQAIGSLAGGVAHDFNNIMTVVMGYCDLLAQQPGMPRESLKHVDGIQKASERAAALTRQLLAFSRRQVMRPEILDLNVVVSDMNKMLRRVIGENIALETRLSDVGHIKVDPGQIEQIILNLAVNARDAMPNGGTLRIETTSVRMDEAYREGVLIHPGDYVTLVVTDTGLGIDPKVRPHIFEPFFTTKDPGMGTGLGLSTVYGIVKQSGGYIFVDSEPGRGATFQALFPRVMQGPPQVHEIEVPLPARTHGGECVLVVEDEGELRTLVREFLELQGYQVLEAANGREAIRVCQDHPGRIDLVLTDVLMPEMGGFELADRLSEVRPETTVAFMSGYAQVPFDRELPIGPSSVLIEKPFASDVLIASVRQILDRNFKQPQTGG